MKSKAHPVPVTLGGPEQDTSLASVSRLSTGTVVPVTELVRGVTYSKGTSTNLVAHSPRRPGRQQAGRRGEGGLRPPRRAQLRLGSCLFDTDPAPSPSPGKRLSRGHEINKGRRGVSVGCGGAAPGEVRVYVRRWPQPRPSTHGPPAPAGSRWGQRRRPGGAGPGLLPPPTTPPFCPLSPS